tara:strand:+ start:4783 stop:5256 length:474 start_codon:yes stop_codon:yes gene_type:complete
MKFKIHIFLILITVLAFSCKNKTEESKLETSEKNNLSTPIEEKSQEPSDLNSEDFIEKLQGEWREPEYPFRRAEFKNSTVKFIEEGIVEEPRFIKFQISDTCPFDSESKDIDSTDPFIVMLEDETCQRIKISNDTLNLSGFSTNTNSAYHIIYKKIN